MATQPREQLALGCLQQDQDLLSLLLGLRLSWANAGARRQSGTAQGCKPAVLLIWHCSGAPLGSKPPASPLPPDPQLGRPYPGEASSPYGALTWGPSGNLTPAPLP